jgi:hypothetical protein
MNVWNSDGTLHVWNLKSPNAPRQPLDPWEIEVDRLMATQMTALNAKARKAAYDRVQQLVSANLPLVFLASPHVLAAGDRNLGNFQTVGDGSSSTVERGSTLLGDAAHELASRATCFAAGDDRDRLGNRCLSCRWAMTVWFATASTDAGGVGGAARKVQEAHLFDSSQVRPFHRRSDRRLPGNLSGVAVGASPTARSAGAPEMAHAGDVA